MYLSDIFTISCNLAGICGISIPCGFTGSQPLGAAKRSEDGSTAPRMPSGLNPQPKLPIGLQLLGRPFGEETLLKIAHAYESGTLWHEEKPAILSELNHSA
jgi:aspartyl-tRNA(Asn)/glutamyl-tRNA(Gln) amidotransferase subunit A